MIMMTMRRQGAEDVDQDEDDQPVQGAHLKGFGRTASTSPNTRPVITTRIANLEW